MRCFGEDRWFAFLKGDISPKENYEMAEHLYSCDRCLELYSSCVNNNLIETDGHYANGVISKLRHKNKNENMKNFVKYVIAASITLILYSSGIFDQMVMVSERFSNEIISINSKLNHIDLNIKLKDIWRSMYEKK